ncbi:MAG: hypothetical protein ACKVZJ_08285 [Phycisphaerales bacterium]
MSPESPQPSQTTGRAEDDAVFWCRHDKKARDRSPFAAVKWWNAQGIGLMHGAGAVIALMMVGTAFINRLSPMTARPYLGGIVTIAVGFVALALFLWGMSHVNRDHQLGTPVGPDGVHRVQCSASKKLRPRLGNVSPQAIEPDLFPVWLTDSPRASGRIATVIACLLGVAFMMFVNWTAFRDPLQGAFITLGLAGPAIGVAVLGIVLPVEWKIAPGQLEVIRPGVLGLGWRASAETIDLAKARLFIDADARTATILAGPRRLDLRWDLASRRDEITRLMLLAALSSATA